MVKKQGRRAAKTEYRSPDRTKNRSDRYQPLFAELPYSNEMMTEVADSQGMDSRNKDEYNEELLNLKEDLGKAFWKLVDTQLTPRQSEVIHLYAEGKTQSEIAKILNVNQSSITKSLNGNCDYKNGRRIYGGAIKKIQRLATLDKDIMGILERISDINSELNDY